MWPLVLVYGSRYEEYRLYIEEKLPPESPILFGMHPNAEISFLNAQGAALLTTIQDLGGGKDGSHACSHACRHACRHVFAR